MCLLLFLSLGSETKIADKEQSDDDGVRGGWREQNDDDGDDDDDQQEGRIYCRQTKNNKKILLSYSIDEIIRESLKDS